MAAAIIENQNGEILLVRRKQSKRQAGCWEFPGWKIEEGETPQQCLIRELREEMNLNIKVSNYIGENIHTYDQGAIRLVVYKGKIASGEIKLADHDQYEWISVQGLKNTNLTPANIPLLVLL